MVRRYVREEPVEELGGPLPRKAMLGDVLPRQGLEQVPLLRVAGEGGNVERHRVGVEIEDLQARREQPVLDGREIPRPAVVPMDVVVEERWEAQRPMAMAQRLEAVLHVQGQVR